MPLQVLVKRVNGQFFADLTPWCTSATISTNEHGTEAIDIAASMPAQIYALFDLYNRSDLVLELNNGSEMIGEARLEDPNIHFRDGVFEAHGLGFFQAFDDIPYTSNYVMSRVNDFRPVTQDDFSGSLRNPARFTMDTNNRLFMGLTKGTTYAAGDEGALVYLMPSQTARKIYYVTFTYEFLATSSFRARLVSLNSGFTDRVEEWTITGTGSIQTGTVTQTFAATRDFFHFGIICASSGTYAGESGAMYFKVTNIKASTSANTTVLSGEIVHSLLNYVYAINPRQISQSITQIAASSFAINDAVYEDRPIADILTELATQDPTRFEVGVDNRRMLYYRPRYSRSNTWFALIDDLSIGRSLNQLYNSGYVLYTNANGDKTRTAIVTNAQSVSEYGITRRQKIDADTSSATQANNMRDASVADSSQPSGRASMPIRMIYGPGAGPVPLWRVRAGDEITVMNLPPNISRDINAIQTYRISRTVYDAINDTLEVEPEDPATTLDAVIAGRV